MQRTKTTPPRSARTLVPALVVITASMLHLSAAAGSFGATVNLRIRLKDGSHLVGKPNTEALAFHAFSTKGNISLNDIREITFLPDRERTRIIFMNNDVLTSVPLFDALNVTTVVGQVSIPTEQISSVNVFNHILHVSAHGAHSAPFTRWSTAATSIQNAVDVANDGDTILVTNGVYIVLHEIMVKKGITVKSMNGSEFTVVDGTMSNRCFFFQHTNAVLDGFTICHGYTTGDGGGLYVDGGSIVRNCNIVSNRCVGGWSQGGGAAILNGSRLESCRISENQGKRGGGASVGRRSLLVESVISGNKATGEWGGGVLIQNGGRVEQCDIVGNSVPRSQGGSGGGVAILNGGYVRRCRIHRNMASSHGAGVYCSGLKPSVVTQCIISDNTRPSGAGCGGGVFLRQGGARIEDSLVVRNHDQSCGGGVQFYDGGFGSKLGGTAVNCTIAMNSSPRGNEVYGNSGRGFLISCIVFNEKPQNLIAGRGLVFSNCCAVASIPGTNNIVADPRFVDFRNGDYRLRSESPCIGVGCPLLTLTNVLVSVKPAHLGPSRVRPSNNK